MQFICQHQKMMTKSKNPPIHWIKSQNPIHISYSHIFFLLSIWGPLYSSSPVRHKARGMGDEWVDPNPGAKHIKITSAAYASLNWIVGLSHRYLSWAYFEICWFNVQSTHQLICLNVTRAKRLFFRSTFVPALYAHPSLRLYHSNACPAHVEEHILQ